MNNQQDLCRRIESLKAQMGFETYMETIVWFHENETDAEMEEISRNLNQKIIDHIKNEAIDVNMLKMERPRDIFSVLTNSPE